MTQSWKANVTSKAVGSVFAMMCATACATDPAAPTGGAASGLISCNFDRFEAEITSGPSTNLKVTGPLLMMLDPGSGLLSGRLGAEDGSVPVTGAVYRSGEISLTLHLREGYVMGLGRMQGDLCASGAQLTGIAVGPRVSATESLTDTDSGHWLLSNPNLVYQLNPNLQLPLDPFEGGGFEDANSGAGGACSESGNTTTCSTIVMVEAGGGGGACTKVTVTCTRTGSTNSCDPPTTQSVRCPAAN